MYMIYFDNYTNENILDHPFRILIIGGSESGKTNSLINLIDNQVDIDKTYLYAKDPFQTKHSEKIF